VLLGIEAKNGEVALDPVLPDRITRLALRNLPGPAGTYEAAAREAAAV
jgi:hypothetical protein